MPQLEREGKHAGLVKEREALGKMVDALPHSNERGNLLADLEDLYPEDTIPEKRNDTEERKYRVLTVRIFIKENLNPNKHYFQINDMIAGNVMPYEGFYLGQESALFSDDDDDGDLGGDSDDSDEDEDLGSENGDEDVDEDLDSDNDGLDGAAGGVIEDALKRQPSSTQKSQQGHPTSPIENDRRSHTTQFVEPSQLSQPLSQPPSQPLSQPLSQESSLYQPPGDINISTIDHDSNFFEYNGKTKIKRSITIIYFTLRSSHSKSETIDPTASKFTALCQEKPPTPIIT